MALVLCVCPPDEMWVTSLSGRRKVLIFSGTVSSQLDRSHTACLEVLPACLPRPSVGKKCTKHAPGCDVCVPFEGQSNGGLIIPPIGHVTPVPVSQTVRSVVAVVVLGSWVSVVCPFAGLKFGVHTLPMMMMMRLRLGNGVVHRFVYVSSWMHTI